MSIGKSILAGTLLTAATLFGISGTAAAYSSDYNWNKDNNRWRNYDGDNNGYYNGRKNCNNSFWIYNRQNQRWVKVGYNEKTDSWEVCRDDNRNYRDGDRHYDDDENYWNSRGHYEKQYKHDDDDD